VASTSHYKETLGHLLNIPESCWPGNAVSEFQTHQCELFWNKLTSSVLLDLFPLIITIGFLLWGIGSMSQVYRRVRKQLDHSSAQFSGIVTQPPEASEDLFSWCFCFRPVAIQLANGHQVKVYVPLADPAPRAGETLAIFAAGIWWGKKRYVGMLYAPHVSVVRAE
jgi:hypothetical protein